MEERKKHFLIGVLSTFFIMSLIFVSSQGVNLKFLDVTDERIISFNNNILTEINSEYNDFQYETGYCMYSNQITDKEIIITKIIKGETFTKSPDFVSFKCNETTDFVGEIHTHKQGSCKLSKADFYMNGVLDAQRDNIPLFTGISCGKDKLTIYSLPQIYGMNVEIGS